MFQYKVDMGVWSHQLQDLLTERGKAGWEMQGTPVFLDDSWNIFWRKQIAWYGVSEQV